MSSSDDDSQISDVELGIQNLAVNDAAPEDPQHNSNDSSIPDSNRFSGDEEAEDSAMQVGGQEPGGEASRELAVVPVQRIPVASVARTPSAFPQPPSSPTAVSQPSLSQRRTASPPPHQPQQIPIPSSLSFVTSSPPQQALVPQQPILPSEPQGQPQAQQMLLPVAQAQPLQQPLQPLLVSLLHLMQSQPQLSLPTYVLPQLQHLMPPNSARQPTQLVSSLPSPQPSGPSPPTARPPPPPRPPTFRPPPPIFGTLDPPQPQPWSLRDNPRFLRPNDLQPEPWNRPTNNGGFGEHSAIWANATPLRALWSRPRAPRNIQNGHVFDVDILDFDADATSDSESELEPNQQAVPVPVLYFPHEIRSYPSLQANFKGTYFIILANTVTIEMSVDRCMRLSFGKVSAFMNGDGTVASITHKNIRMMQRYDKFAAKFSVSVVTDQHVIAGGEGILLTASNLDNAYLISYQQGVSYIPLRDLDFSLERLNGDICETHFKEFAMIGGQYYDVIQDIVGSARFYKKRPWRVNLYVQGAFVRYVNHGEVVYRCGQLSLHYNRRSGCMSLKTPFIEISIKEGSQVQIKYGNKRFHVSRMGIMVADGIKSASMDHFGRLVSLS